MARSRGGREVPYGGERLRDMFADKPAATTGAKAPAQPQEATPAQALPDLPAELRQIRTQLDALAKRSAAPTAGAAANAEKAIGELRSSVEAAARGTKEARDALCGRLEKIEAVAGDLAAAPRAAREIVESLKLARSSLVGLSERMEGLERRLPEKSETIEHAADAVREATCGLAATGKTLEAAARANAQALPQVTHIADEAFKLKRAAYWGWTVVSCLVVIVLFPAAAADVIGLIGEWSVNLKTMVLG